MSFEVLAEIISCLVFLVILFGSGLFFGFSSYDLYFDAKKQKALARLLNARAQQVEASNSTPSGEDKK